jgi:hypothetical protein
VGLVTRGAALGDPLVSMAERGTAPAAICASPARRDLLPQIEPYAKLEEAAAFDPVLRNGSVIASQHEAY